MKVPSCLKKAWEHRFPDVGGKWTHWKITGAEKLLGVVEATDLAGAIRVVENNYGRFISIRAYRATVDENGNLNDEEKAIFEISNLTKDEILRESSRDSDA